MRTDKKKWEWYLGFIALLTVVLTGYIGNKRSIQQQKTSIQQLVDYPERFITQIGAGVYEVKPDTGAFRLLLTEGKGMGYAGPVKVVVKYDETNIIQGIFIMDTRETPSYLQKVINQKFPDQFTGKDPKSLFAQPFKPDVISGATKTSKGITEAVKASVKNLSRHRSIEIKETSRANAISFSHREALILGLFAIGLIVRLKRFKYKNILIWISLLVSMLFIGFLYNQPISLTRINSMLLGYWPNWHDELYIILLIGGVLLILLTSGKNVYCQSMCPFGAFQRVLGKIGKARPIKIRHRFILIWLQRSMAWIAILIALFFRNPTVSEYEVYSNLFQFTGTHKMFILLALVILLSLFISRPWCSYICPLKAIFDYLLLFRNKVKNLLFK